MPLFDRKLETTDRARKLRRAMTRYEVQLWVRLRGAQMGVSFRKQHPIGPYIVDFAAPSIQIVVELDGGHHGTPDEAEADRKRDEFLASKGWTVLRFWNSDVFENCDGVAETIWNRVRALSTTRQRLPPDRAVSSPPPAKARPGRGRQP